MIQGNTQNEEILETSPQGVGESVYGNAQFNEDYLADIQPREVMLK